MLIFLKVEAALIVSFFMVLVFRNIVLIISTRAVVIVGATRNLLEVARGFLRLLATLLLVLIKFKMDCILNTITN